MKAHVLWWVNLMIIVGTRMIVDCLEWKHSVVLDSNFLVLWTPGEKEVEFEVQVKTLGYVGLGFVKRKDEIVQVGADMVIGWVDNNGQVHLQDRHTKGNSKDPQMDSSQDYRLLFGYENKTHTVLGFSRRYDTCDPRDLKITNDTMQVVWQYHEEEPVSMAGVLPEVGTVRGSRPLYLVQRDTQPKLTTRNQLIVPTIHTWDILNHQVPLPTDKNSVLWCQVVKLPGIVRKHHVIKYEPVIQPGSQDYLHDMTLYECRGDQIELEAATKNYGGPCYQPDQPALQCHTIAAIWSIGSEGFNYPLEAGYPLDPIHGSRYFMLETHYSDIQLEATMSDNSGLRLSYTDRLRVHDAGILSIGIDPNWRHIIPPGQRTVVSEGHCITNCTGQTIPSSGINLFAVIMHTHKLGRKVRLRQIRSAEELPPIASDTNFDPNYQEYRRLERPVKVYPGDHLIAECSYSSESRQAITLGGLTTREETCLVTTVYYPRIDFSLCYSLPSLPTVLHSLGISKLMQGSNPVKIQSPPELHGMTLEERLRSYDWERSFETFQEATHSGTFKPLCWNSRGSLPGTDILEVHYPRILHGFNEMSPPCTRKTSKNQLSMLLGGDRVESVGDMIDYEENELDETSYESNAFERGQLVRSKVSRSSEGQTIAGGDSLIKFIPSTSLLLILCIVSSLTR